MNDDYLAPDVIVGLGARASATSAEILALVDTTLAAHGLTRADLAACATLERKATHPALRAAAATLGLPLLTRTEAELTRPVPTPSLDVLRHIGLPSVAEAAALSFGPLVAPKQRSANATCALSRRVPAQSPMAASAASTLSTSGAGS